MAYSGVKRKTKKKGIKSVILYLSLVIVLSLLAYGYNIFNTYLQESLSSFELEDIHISGNNILTEDEILKILGFKTGEQLLEISPVDVVEKLKDNAYVRAVNAIYSLPSTLRITIVEREPVAFIYGRGLNLIDKENFILPVPHKNIRWNLPVITGVKEKLGLQGAETISEDAKLAVQVVRYIRVLDMPLKEMVSEISLANDDYMEIGLSGSSGIIKIDYDNYQDQLFIAAKYLTDYLDFNRLDKLDYMDVRFSNQIVVKEIKV